MEAYSTTQIARVLGVEAWRIRRVFEVGAVPEPVRIAGRRIIPGQMIPSIVDALRQRGWLPAMGGAANG